MRVQGNNNNIENIVPKNLFEYGLPLADATKTSIVISLVGGNQNFEIKTKVIRMVQQSRFVGLSTEEPQVHLTNFVEIRNTFKLHNVFDEAIRLRLFPFFLRDRAKA